MFVKGKKPGSFNSPVDLLILQLKCGTMLMSIVN